MAQKACSSSLPIGFRFLAISQSKLLLIRYVYRFYDELMVDNFRSFPDELETVLDWLEMLNRSLYKKTSLSIELICEHPSGQIAGGVVHEYYPKSRCGLLAYWVVSHKFRRLGFGRALVKRTVETLHVIAAPNHLNYLFAETNNPFKVAAANDSIPPKSRLKRFRKIGFRLVDIEFVQPALSSTQKECTHLILLCLTKEKTLPVHILLEFLTEYMDSMDIQSLDVSPKSKAMIDNLKIIQKTSETINTIDLDHFVKQNEIISKL